MAARAQKRALAEGLQDRMEYMSQLERVVHEARVEAEGQGLGALPPSSTMSFPNHHFDGREGRAVMELESAYVPFVQVETLVLHKKTSLPEIDAFSPRAYMEAEQRRHEEEKRELEKKLEAAWLHSEQTRIEREAYDKRVAAQLMAWESYTEDLKREVEEERVSARLSDP